jgi:hypothetical protein
MRITARHLLRKPPTVRLVPQPQAARRRSSMPTTRSAKAILSHQERTASEPRDDHVHAATVSKVTDVNDRIKTFRFDICDKNGFNVLSAPFPSRLSTCADG